MPEQNWNEHRTRKQYIDKLLINSGWGPIVAFEEGKNYDHGSVEEYPTQTGPCDYALFHSKHPLAAVEGKKVSVGPQNVLQQAQRYARGFQKSPFTFGEYHLPFIYSTNGKIMWLAWGGDAGFAWSRAIVNREKSKTEKLWIGSPFSTRGE